MLAEAERYREEDERQREKISARNSLEGYVFSVKQALDQAGDKLSDSEKSSVRSKCDEVIQWLDANALADKDEFEHKMKELQQICNPVMTKMHGAGNSSCGQQASSQRAGPTVEEVD